MDLIPELPINDCLMLTGVSCPFVDGIADVNPVVQQLVKDTFIEEMAVPIGGLIGDQFPRQ